MSTSGYGAAADHAALTGLTSGDPHTQYANWLQGPLAARPIQPVRAGVQYLATDSGLMYVSDGGQWRILQEPGSIAQGTKSTIPAAATAGQGATFWATDEQELYRSDGTGWYPITAEPAKFGFARLFLARG